MVPLIITKTLNQVTPHQHPLVREEAAKANLTNDDEVFVCSGCDTDGFITGVRYRCKQQYCNFNLHEVCATCPKILSTHFHPKHQLKLVWSFKDDLPCCHVCGYQVKGLYYSCPDPSCNNGDNTFVLHPICSKFPSHVPHVIDRKHNLTFQSTAPAWCTICKDLCTSWRYQCAPCGINVHIECVISAIPSHDSPNSGVSAPKKQQQQQQYQSPPFPPPPPPPPPDLKDNYSYHAQLQHQYNYQQPPRPPPMQHHHNYHHHQEKHSNHFAYPLQQPTPPPPPPPYQQQPQPQPQQQHQYYHHHQLPVPFGYPLQQPPLMQQQQQHHYHHHQEKYPLPNHFGYPLQQPPPPPAHNFVYNPSSVFGMVSPPPVHQQYYYGMQQQHQYYQQPPPFVAHPNNMHYEQQPAYCDQHQGGGGGCGGGSEGGGDVTNTSSSSSTSSSGGGRKRRMSLMVAKLVAYLTLTSVVGPIIPSPF